ncbi:hypothetical protein SPBR_05375 [Sporothrix brasiliensis 5110]|uniref:Tautomerase cis-CaaD-like domain-containing protein n=1 Tax=Sporothrix brasiliensis 5110 TaxID=1398154 RepID=A0A0C2IQB9_9PEZI|nr:uncharacterized protein SPBR_05375 [Sporothrix brasiliensis 5110]KIH87252.1 hypothetical protein SPBR_05375 [Sporothrix brasiliensis 5110]
MPLWQFFHPPTAFSTAAEKQAVVDDVTRMYTGIGLPAFYVVVQFFPLDVSGSGGNFFVGGQPATNFVRIVIHHLAFQSQGSVAAHTRIASNVDGVVQPHLEARGFDWEYHVSESPPTMWKINGYVPPVMGNPAVTTWAKENKPSAYEGDGRSKTEEGGEAKASKDETRL